MAQQKPAADQTAPLWQQRRRVWWLLAALWLVWAHLLCGGLLAGSLDTPQGERFALAGRMGSSAVLVVAGWTWFVANRSSPSNPATMLVAVGITFGCLGDLFNAGLLQAVVPLPNPVLGGIIAFGLGHFGYIAACLRVAKRGGLRSKVGLYVATAMWQVVGIGGWFFVVLHGTVESARILVWPALPYSALLAATAGFASGLAAQDRRLIALAAGAALFLVSDLILAWRLFRGEFPYAGEAVWLTYGPGQMLIVFSNAGIRRVLGSQATG